MTLNQWQRFAIRKTWTLQFTASYFCQVLHKFEILYTFCRICFPAPTVHRIADGPCTVMWQWWVLSLIGLALKDLSVEVLISWRSTCFPVTGQYNFADYVICSTEQLQRLLRSVTFKCICWYSWLWATSTDSSSWMAGPNST
jgi:hypothetical protein